MIFRRATGAGVGGNAHCHTAVSRGEHSGKHTAIGGDTTYRDFFGALDGFAQHASPLAESVATDHGMALRQFRGIRGEIVHRIVGSNQKLRPIFEIINPSVLRRLRRNISRVDHTIAERLSQSCECFISSVIGAVRTSPCGPFTFRKNTLPVDNYQPFIFRNHDFPFLKYCFRVSLVFCQTSETGKSASCLAISPRWKINEPARPTTNATMTPRLAAAQLPSLPPMRNSR